MEYIVASLVLTITLLVNYIKKQLKAIKQSQKNTDAILLVLLSEFTKLANDKEQINTLINKLNKEEDAG